MNKGENPKQLLIKSTSIKGIKKEAGTPASRPYLLNASFAAVKAF